MTTFLSETSATAMARPVASKALKVTQLTATRKRAWISRVQVLRSPLVVGEQSLLPIVACCTISRRRRPPTTTPNQKRSFSMLAGAACLAC